MMMSTDRQASAPGRRSRVSTSVLPDLAYLTFLLSNLDYLQTEYSASGLFTISYIPYCKVQSALVDCLWNDSCAKNDPALCSVVVISGISSNNMKFLQPGNVCLTESLHESDSCVKQMIIRISVAQTEMLILYNF